MSVNAEKVETSLKNSSIDESKIWYNSLPIDAKRRIFDKVINKFPYIQNMMKMNKIRASSHDFTEHWTFKLFIEILNDH